MQERKQGNDGHLQHVMATLVIIYNLYFDFFFFFDVILICLYFQREHSGSGRKQSISRPSVTLIIK